ncbi:MAG: 4Fe-4S dicluster domain-containing protein [Thermodesulfobacteriota bacterium]|nr:4Fe-4S dicluster domain-containing protein [Thermodesulfobacteriota bacterium]
MKTIKIKKSEWAGAMDKARNTYRLAGPVKHQDYHVFRELEAAGIPDLEYGDLRISPKTVVMPQSEPMFTFNLDEHKEDHHVLHEVPFDDTPRAVVGIRPYDARAIQILKKNFDTDDYQDPYFLRRYNCCTFIGLADTDPSPTNFSLSCGTGPFDETDLDMLLVDTGDDYIGKVLTDKGEAFAAAAGFKETDAAEADATIAEMKTKAEAQITTGVEYDNIAAMDELTLHQAPFWEEIAFACINCGTCTFACPTCWCFDIQDEVEGKHGIRMRNWDTCMSEVYSRHASGHDPRGKPFQRTRNRFMHKLKYFLDKYNDGIMCVGCGRCISQCPVNIDIRTVCKTMNDYQPEN